MSAHNSDSDGSWDLVDTPRHDEGHSSSDSSVDFVKVQSSEAVSYHHKEQGAEAEAESDGSESATGPLVNMDMEEEEEEEAVTHADDEASSIEEVDLMELNTQAEGQQSIDLSEVPVMNPGTGAPTIESAVPQRFKKPRNGPSLSSVMAVDSESDHSDFVRLEPPTLSEMEAAAADVAVPSVSAPPTPPPGVMRISSTSSTSSGQHTGASSISSSFRFVLPASPPINPVVAQQEQEYVRRRGSRRCYRRGHSVDDLDGYAFVDDSDDSDAGAVPDSDLDSVPSDVDDRCESDISGVAVDDDDDDGWGMDDGEIPLSVGNVRRSYRHHTNTSLNSVLTTLTIMALFSAVGIGIGHFLGIQRELNLRKQQEFKMRDLQDDYLMVLKQRDTYLKQINDPVFPDTKLNAITGVWKQKYEDLIVEKVELEQRIQDLEQELEHQTEVAHLQAENHAEEMDHLQQELSGLKVQHSTSMIQAEVQLVEAREEDKQQMTELEALSERLAEQEEKNRDLLASLQTITNATSHDHTELISITGTALAEIEAKEAELITKEEELSTKEAELSTKGEELSVKEAELSSKGEQLVEKESAIMTRETELATIESELSVLTEKTQLVRQQTELVEVKKMELAELKEQVAVVKQRFQEVTTALAERKAELVTTKATKVAESVLEMVNYKKELNLLRHENQDLRSRLTSALYQQHPAQDMENTVVVEDPIMDELPPTPPTIIEVLPVDNTQQDVDIEIISTEEEEENETTNIHEALQSTKSQLMEAEERAQRFEASHKECMANVPADFLGCMRLLLPNITTPGVNVTEFMEKILHDTRFSKAMEQHWAEFYMFLQRGKDMKLPKKIKQAFSDVEKIIKLKWSEFVKFASQQEDVQKASKFTGERFQSVVNKTKETVSQLSEKIHNTWTKVRNLSSSLMKEDEGKIRKISEAILDKFGSVGRKVEKGWDKVKEQVSGGGWFHSKKSKGTENKYQGHAQDHYGNSPFAQEKTEDVGREEFAKADSQGFTSKADNKQTQSSSLQQEYEEFWKRANFDPDDYVAEDFFQGNQREWKKEQKRFKKLHGRIHRLNEDMLYSMDEDDIEDMYEDLDDFEDDVDVDEQPAKLKNWLTCQIRWWKSRFQRKHRNEDFVRGCEAQLMRWQLRAMCQPLCRSKKCRRRATNNMDACQALYAQPVIKPTSNDEEAKDNGRSVNETVVSELSMKAVEHVPLIAGRLYTGGMMDKRGKDEEQVTDFIMVDPRTPEAGTGDHDSSWVFERYHAREYQRQEKPDWLFKRANRRAFEREKPWYFKRADQRRQMWVDKHDKR